MLEEVLEHIDLDENAFKAALDLYMSEKDKEKDIRGALDDAMVDRQEGLPAEERKEREVTMNKKEAIAGQKVIQDISIEQIKLLKQLPPAELQDEVRYVTPKLSDKLWLTTGIELEDLVYSSQQLEIEKDKEYLTMMDEYE